MGFSQIAPCKFVYITFKELFALTSRSVRKEHLIPVVLSAHILEPAEPPPLRASDATSIISRQFTHVSPCALSHDGRRSLGVSAEPSIASHYSDAFSESTLTAFDSPLASGR